MHASAKSAFRRLLAAGLLLAALAGCQTSGELTPEEKRLLLTAGDLAAVGFPLERLGREKFEKTRNSLDRSVELSYVMDAGDKGLYVTSSLTVEASDRKAALGDKAFEIGLSIGLKHGGLEAEEVALNRTFGRKSRFSLLKKEGRPVGNLFTALADRKVYQVMFVGLYFDDPALFERLVGPKIEALAGYAPAGRRR
jgi:hypothetical protein